MNDRYQRNATRDNQYSKYFESSESESEFVSEEEEETPADEQVSIYEKSQPPMKPNKRKQGRVEDSQAENDESESEKDESESEDATPVRVKRGAKAKASTGSLKQTKLNMGKKTSSLPKRNGRGINKVVDSMMKEESEESVSESEEEVQSSEGEDDSDKEWEEYCYVCQDGGNVMCCDGCTQVAHFDCLDLKKEPKGDWFCKDCAQKKAVTQTTQPKKTAQKAPVVDPKKTRHSRRAGAGTRKA